jgi:Protein of unknown function (DUF551)
MSEWQPIETAPKDGTRILIFDQNIYIASWSDEVQFGQFEFRPGWQIFDVDGDQFYSVASEHPTHWMSLPAPPSQ